MVKIDEHKKRMEEIKKEADASSGARQKQLMKCYHRMRKQLNQCVIFIAGGEVRDGKH